MKDLLRKIENTMSAVAFAEEGEVAAARAILAENTASTSGKTDKPVGISLTTAHKGAAA